MRNNIREIRKQRRLTQAELADRAKVTRRTISRLERERDTNITAATMEGIAEALGVPVSIVFDTDAPVMNLAR